ncbi:Xaa-Pro peptidase family protein [Agrobacterium vitis]
MIEAAINRMDFPLEEYRARLDRTQEEMAKYDLPVLLLHQPENINYLTGLDDVMYVSYLALIVPRHGNPVFVIRDMEVSAAQSTSWVKDCVVYPDAGINPLGVSIEAARKALDDLGFAGGRIGLDDHSWFLTAERWKLLQMVLPHATLVAEPQIVDHLRLIKSKREIDNLRSAARSVDAGMRVGLDAIKDGVSERELAVAVYSELTRACTQVPDGCQITSGDRTNLIHGWSTDRRLERGDPVYFELNGIHKGYWARLMRTATVGPATTHQRRVAEKIITIQDEAIALMRAGVPASVVDKACREPILAAGLRQTYTNRTGYSLGLNQRPSTAELIRDFLPDVKWVLQPGMVFHMVAIAAGMGFSETVLITEDGPERLTRLDRALFESA